jgi:hypothetical protein
MIDNWPIYAGERHIHCGHCNQPLTSDDILTLAALARVVDAHALDCVSGGDR